MKHILITIAAVVLVGCGRFENSAPSSDAKPELKSSKPTDDSGNYIMSEPGTQGAAFSLTLKSDGTFQGVTLASRDTGCLLYTSPSPRDRTRSRMPSSA